MLPFYKNVSVFVYRPRQSDESIEMWVRVKMWSCCAWIYARVCGGTAWADSLNLSGYVLFGWKSLSECDYIFGITIIVLKISQKNDNRGRHLEFYFHTGIGNWFQCFLVYPGLNLSSGPGSGSVSGSGSGFRVFHTPQENMLVLWFIHISKTVHFMERSKLDKIVKGVPFAHRRNMKPGVTFLSKVVYKR